jgi:transposase
LHHPQANEQARITFQEMIKRHKAAGKPIVYIDESGFAVDMPRTHGYSQKGQRCIGINNWQARGRINVIGAMLGKGLLTTALFNGTIDSEVFHCWVTQDLLPKLQASSVIVMDNATFHKRNDTQQVITKAGHILEFLPPYSPDLNPIEHKWAQAKGMRRTANCSVEQLFALPNI